MRPHPQMVWNYGDCPRDDYDYRAFFKATNDTWGFAGRPISTMTLKPTATEDECAAACIKSSEAAYARGKLGCTAYTFGIKANRPRCLLFDNYAVQCTDPTASAKDPGCSSALQNIASKILWWKHPNF